MKNLIALLLLFSSYSASSQIYFKNNTEEPVKLAFCKYYDVDGSKYWGCAGWYYVEPGDNIVVSSGIGLYDNIYYYAESTVSDKKYQGTTTFLVDPTDKFFIKNADKEYQMKINPNFTWYKFRHIDMQQTMFQMSYTIELNY